MQELLIADPDISKTGYRELFDVISSGYEFIQLVDPPPGTVHTLKISRRLRLLIGDDVGPDPLASIISRAVSPEHRQRALRSTDRERILNSTENSITSESTDIKIISNDESFSWLRINIIFLNSFQNRSRSYLVTLSNISSIRKTEEHTFSVLQAAFDSARSANEEKDHFLACLSHDMKTPIHNIIGMTDMALEHIDEKERLKSCLSSISLASKHLVSFCNEMAYMAGPDKGRISLRKEVVDICALSEEISNIVRADTESRHQNFTYDISAVRDSTIIGDELRLRQCLMNFLTNAVKYTPENGRISFTVSQGRAGSKDEHVYKFVFRDSGCGMSQEFADRICEPFLREHNRYTLNTQGTGLGMAISSDLLDRMGGNMKVWSRPGRGSVFTVRIPLMPAAVLPPSSYPEGAAPSSIREDHMQCDLSGLNFLIADDNDINLDILEDMLVNAGASVESARNGMEALDIFSNSPEGRFDIIILDIKMPVMDGYEASFRIRSLKRKDSDSIPLFALTADILSEKDAAPGLHGINEYISKPFSRDDLFYKIRKWIK